jgi:hypothetical protein
MLHKSILLKDAKETTSEILGDKMLRKPTYQGEMMSENEANQAAQAYRASLERAPSSS